MRTSKKIENKNKEQIGYIIGIESPVKCPLQYGYTYMYASIFYISTKLKDILLLIFQFVKTYF